MQLTDTHRKAPLSPAGTFGGRHAAETGQVAVHAFLVDPANRREIECALRIRAVENSLYELFGRGKLHGTIHTCVGQEFSGAMLSRHMREGDFVTSNHRCHGHFIGATQNWRGLIDEVVGNVEGVCAGIGSSQHLWAKNFISNGQQGGLLPVAAGVALDRKIKGDGSVVFSFLGEGTLGEGVFYETLNLDALWGLPHVVICENNFYSQSTPQDRSVAGSIVDRAAAFSIASILASTWDLSQFDATLATAVERARLRCEPTFVCLSTYRLNPHSKGDDTRDKAEVDWYRARDPASIAVRDYGEFKARFAEYTAEANEYAESSLHKRLLGPQTYFIDQLPRSTPSRSLHWDTARNPSLDQPRIAQQLNEFYHQWLARDPDAVFIGEDIEDPYGGAFKIAKGLTTKYPARARTTPISEAAITGVGIGLALCGRRSFVEIMFGDFITYAFDQIINNASKFFHMYNHSVNCPVIVRTPMGGRRGYGPTHSQSLERFLIGIDNCCLVSLNSLANVGDQLASLAAMNCPVILLENKSDYAAKTFAAQDGFTVEINRGVLPTIRVRPLDIEPTVTILCYGGMARFVADHLVEIFQRTDELPELVVPASLSPLDLEPIVASVAPTRSLVIAEEGAAFGSVGAEVISQLTERNISFRVARVAGKPVPVPSAPALEAATLPSVDDICRAVTGLMGAGDGRY